MEHNITDGLSSLSISELINLEALYSQEIKSRLNSFTSERLNLLNFRPEENLPTNEKLPKYLTKCKDTNSLLEYTNTQLNDFFWQFDYHINQISKITNNCPNYKNTARQLVLFLELHDIKKHQFKLELGFFSILKTIIQLADFQYNSRAQDVLYDYFKNGIDLSAFDLLFAITPQKNIEAVKEYLSTITNDDLLKIYIKTEPRGSIIFDTPLLPASDENNYPPHSEKTRELA